MKRGCGCWKAGQRRLSRRRNRQWWADDGGSAPALREPMATGGWMNKRRRERPLRSASQWRQAGWMNRRRRERPLPLRPPTPSVRMSGVYSQAGRNRLLRFTTVVSRHWKMPAPSCKHGSRAFSNSPPCFFHSLCHILLHRPAAEGHGCVMRRLGMAGPLSANSLLLLPHEGKYTILFQIAGTKQMKSSSK